MKICGSGSSVGIVTELRVGRSGDRIPVGGEIFRLSRPALGSTQPPIQWVSGLSWGKVRPGRDANPSPPSSAEVLEELSYTFTPLWATTGPVTGLLYLLPYADIF
jgi:hypothetical protein